MTGDIPPQSARARILVCDRCGVTRIEGSRFCGSCGNDFSPDEPRDPTPDSYSAKKKEERWLLDHPEHQEAAGASPLETTEGAWLSPAYSDAAGGAAARLQPAVRPKSRKATWALVAGILGLLAVPFLFSVLAIVLGTLARADIKRDPQLAGKGKATAGLVLGVIALVVFAIVVAITLSGR